MKEKVIAKFKAKFPAVTLSTKRMDEIADRLSKKVTNEDEIDTKLDEMNEMHPFADIQKSDDQIRDLKSKVKASTQTPPDTTNQSGSTDKQDGKTTPDETPPWAKSLVESNQKLAEKLAAMEKEKFQQTMQQRITAHDKLKGIPSVFYKGRALPEKEEDLETFVDGIKTDFDTFKQESNNEGLVNGYKPGGANGGANNSKTSEMFNQVMAVKKKEAEAATQNKN